MKVLTVRACDDKAAAAPITGCRPGTMQRVYHVLALLESDTAGTVATGQRRAARARLAALHERLEKQAMARRLLRTSRQFHMASAHRRQPAGPTGDLTDLHRKVMKLNRHHSLFCCRAAFWPDR